MELLLGDGLAEARESALTSVAGSRVVGPLEVTNRFLSQVIDYVIFFGALVRMLRRQADGVLLVATRRARVAVAAQHLQLRVNELGRANLNRLLRLELVRRGVVCKPQSRRSLVALAHHLLFLLLQHDDLLFPLLRGGGAGNGGPCLRVEGLALEHLGLTFGAWL